MSTSPWHQLCSLRDDVRTGKLTLDEFAADLYGVRTREAPAVYREPTEFFARTYPTYRMKLLVRDVLLRLAGEGGKPVLQLQVAYGGGKTHTLITLFHLAQHAARLMDQRAEGERTVHEFLAFAGLPQAPVACIALLPFDKFDIKEGLQVHGPHGEKRRVRTPWGALAYQLGGDAGYARLKAHDEDFTVPAEPPLVDLLRIPHKEGLGALVLVDEAVWYYRNLVLSNPRLLGALKDFYQVLTQAVVKVERSAMVAALIASKVEAHDQTGIQCLQALDDVFGRIAEPVEPVAREDVAEILRRRLFEHVPGEEERRPVVDAVMASLQKLPLRDSQRDQEAYDRLMDSYPFHPDLIEVMYQKWTQMGRFQRTRGALRLLASAVREAEGKDPSPLIGPTTLLPWVQEQDNVGRQRLSPALNELVKICEERDRWTPILSGELEKAQDAQAELPTLKQRSVEAAVVSTFLHSQPSGSRAQPSELLAFLAHPKIDLASLEEGLGKWRQMSWFLVDNPEVWQLGTTANLTHMHVQAMAQLTEAEIDDELRRRIKAIPRLTSADSGVIVHSLPKSPVDVSDDEYLRYLILGPECALDPVKALPIRVEAYFDYITGPQNPRTYRNNILALAPEISRLAGLREQVRRWLGWNRIKAGDAYSLLTELQRKDLPRRQAEAAHGLPEAVVGAYTVLVAVNERGQVQAQMLRGNGVVGGTPFERIKSVLAEEERLLVATLDPVLLLPGSYLEIWREGETARRAADLLSAFGQFPRLPRLLRPDALYDTLTRGVQEGNLVLRLPRADGSARTWWRIPPDADTLRRRELEVQPANMAQLHNLETALLAPDRLAELNLKMPLSFQQLQDLFDGTTAPRLISPTVLADAMRLAVQQGSLMALVADQTYFDEPLPEGAPPADMLLFPAPAPLHGADLTPQALPTAWSEGETTPRHLTQTLAEKRGYPIPWRLLCAGIEDALRLRLFERDPDEGPWPCSPAAADGTVFRVIEDVPLTAEMVASALDYEAGRAPTLRALKERIEEKFTGRSIADVRLIGAVEQAVNQGLVAVVDYAGLLSQAPNPLGVRIARPATAMIAETTLSPAELQKLAEGVERLLTIAPELVFTFRMSLTAEGERPSADVLARLNEVLNKIQTGWELK